MAKKHLYKELRNIFFSIIEEKYKNVIIDIGEGGRWNLIFDNGIILELSNISYGGDIDLCFINDISQNELGEQLKFETQEIWESLKPLFPELY